jgi:hypothetical protein
MWSVPKYYEQLIGPDLSSVQEFVKRGIEMEAEE